MAYTVELMDAAKAAQGIASDYRLAQVLGVTRAAVSNWRCGAKTPNYTSTCALAQLAGVDPGAALLGVGIDRNSAPERAQALRAAGRAMLAESAAPG